MIRTTLCVILILAIGFSISTVLNRRASEPRLKDSASHPLRQSQTDDAVLEDEKLKRAKVSESYGQLPLSFEVNQGQADARVKFQSRGSGYSLFLTDTEAVLSLSKPEPDKDKGEAARRRAVLRMRPVGANPQPQIKGVKELPGKTNYYIGNDPEKWRTAIQTYERVEYESVYPGVDMAYYGNQRQLEYDFIVAPGARPSIIELDFDGADGLEINDKGDLVIAVGDAEVVQSAPVIYQLIGAERRTVTGRYALREKGRVGFEIDAYDSSKTLVIDPTINYATYLGGSGFDWAWGMAIDSQGTVFVTGEAGAGFTTKGASIFDSSHNGMADVFVSKLTPNLNVPSMQQLVYSTYLGGADNDRGVDVALDSGQTLAFVIGYTSSNNFPTMGNMIYDASHNGGQDAFVAKLTLNGGLTWSTYLGGSGNDTGASIAVDSQGIAFVTGYTAATGAAATDYQQTTGDTTHNGGLDVFVTKMTANGGRTWSTFIGGGADDYVTDIALEGGTVPYITGWAYDAATDYPTTVGAYDTTHNGSSDAFVTKLSANGSTINYSTFIGSTDREESNAMFLSTGGVVTFTGFTMSNNFPTTANTFSNSLSGGTYGDVFVAQVNTSNPANRALTFSTYLGGNGSETSQDIAVDSAGFIYVAGGTESTNFPVASAIQSMHGGGFDMFLTKLNPAAQGNNILVFSTYLGGSSHDVSTGMVLDSVAQVYLCGFSWGGMGGNIITMGAHDTSFNTNPMGGPSDAVIIKLTP
jgi:Beta-propeller repeat.